MPYCTSCGAEIGADDSYCRKCGTATDSSDSKSSRKTSGSPAVKRLADDLKSPSSSRRTSSTTSQPAQSSVSTHESNGGILSGIFWMGLLSLLLFWLPLLGPLIAGYVGGKKSGGVFNGILAAILPAIIIGIFISGTGAAINLPIIGLLLGGAASFLFISHSLGLVTGAIIGGALS